MSGKQRTIPLSHLSEKPVLEALPKTGYIRAKKLAPFLALAEVTLWRMSKRGDFPRPIKLTENATAWKCEEVHEWLNSRELVA